MLPSRVVCEFGFWNEIFVDFLVQSWCNVGAKLVQSWCNVSAKLVQCWCNVGAKLVQCWCKVFPQFTLQL